MNSFLYKVRQKGITSPLCNCGEQEQKPYHCLVECKDIDLIIKDEMKSIVKSYYEDTSRSGLINLKDHITLLNMSRNKRFIQMMLKIIKSKRHTYRTKIVLNTRSQGNDPVTN